MLKIGKSSNSKVSILQPAIDFELEKFEMSSEVLAET
jgi:hypothetical protein